MLEQLQDFLAATNDHGMLFGDFDDAQVVSRAVRDFSNYSSYGTLWTKNRKIDRLLDTVHFAKSHHSRMIQLADTFLYCSQFLAQENQSWWRRNIAELIESHDISSLAFKKEWEMG